MKIYIVTIKVKHGIPHNPRDKITGPCPAVGYECSDCTGEHHSFLYKAKSIEEVKEKFNEFRLTRVEEAVEWF